MLPLHAMMTGNGVERLGAAGPPAPGQQVGRLHERPRLAGCLHHLGRPKRREVDLFVPAAHLGPAVEPVTGLGEIAGPGVALGEVEDRPAIFGVVVDFRLQNLGVAHILQRIAVPCAQPPRADRVIALEPCLGEGHVADSHFVEHPRIPPRHAVSEQLATPVGRAVAEPHAVGVG